MISKTEQIEKFLFLSDLHGDFNKFSSAVFWGLAKNYTVYILGDLVDSFKHSRKNQLKCLELLLALKDNLKVKYLLGNHELSYLFLDHRATGHSKAFQAQSVNKLRILQKQAEPAFSLKLDPAGNVSFNSSGLGTGYKSILMTHAGLNPALVPLGQLATPFEWIKAEYELNKFRFYTKHDLSKVGFGSGGFTPNGGIFWGRPYEEWDYGFTGIIQIFGHSYTDSLHFDKDRSSVNLDVKENSILTLYKRTNLVTNTVKYEFKTRTARTYM